MELCRGSAGGWNPHHPSSCHQWICNGEVQGEREGDAIPPAHQYVPVDTYAVVTCRGSAIKLTPVDI